MCSGWPSTAKRPTYFRKWLPMWKKALSLLLAASAISCFAAVEVNQANEAELDSVKGLGPSSTARILKARSQGEFKNWADLMARVKGIKPATATRLSRDGLTVNGDAFPQATTTP
jgi:competence protein ComEA